MIKSILIAIITFSICFIVVKDNCLGFEERPLSSGDVLCLMHELQGCGFEQDYLQELFTDPRLQFIPGLVKPIAGAHEPLRIYKRFMKPDSLVKARRFAMKWKPQLNALSREFAVNSEVVVAILLVETGLGNWLGRYSVISIFTSIILDNYRIGKELQEADIDQHAYLKRLTEKAEWAKQELQALLIMYQEFDIDIFSLQGSRAGAFGIPQFLPSSYIGWGHDGDCNQEIDLFCMSDAIASTMKYLKAHGWQYGLEGPSNREVLWQYNHSNAYVETVLKIAALLQTATKDTKTKSALKQSLKRNRG